MKKNKLGFILGIIGLLSSAIVSLYSFLTLSLIFAIAKSPAIYYIALYANLFSNLIIIIGLCLYFTQSKISGILFLIAFILNIIVYILALTLGVEIQITLILIAIIPSILIIVASIINLTKNIN